MKSSKPTHVRILSSFRKEALAAIKGHWCHSLLILILTAVVMMLPFAAAIFAISYIPMPTTELLAISDPWSAEALVGVLATVFGVILLAEFAAFLLSPLPVVTQNKLSLRLLNEEKISLRTVLPTAREWGKCLRVAILGFIYSMWPVFLGSAVLCAGFAYLTLSQSAAELLAQLSAGLIALPVLALLALYVYSVTRSVSYMAADYFLILFPEYNARTLLKTSRRCMKGYKGRFFLLSLSFIGWIMLTSVVPSLLRYIPADLLPPDVTDLLVNVLTLLFTLPVSLYANTALAAYVQRLPIDR